MIMKRKILPFCCCNILTLAILLTANTPARAQYDSFFGHESWEYATGIYPITGTADYDPYLLSCLTNIYHFTSSDTVTIDGELYYNSSAEGWWTCPVKLREDTMLGRLYALIEGREFLVCDMSLESGDTFNLPALFYNFTPEDTIRLVVDSVTFVNSKKVIHLSVVVSSEAAWYDAWYYFPFSDLTLEGVRVFPLRFMEGIGSMLGIIPPYKLGESLFCLTKDDTLYYMTHPDIGCWQVYVNVPDYPEQAMTIFPNPADNLITIRFETEEEVRGIVYIRDNLGRVCSQTEISKPSVVLNISNLPSGIYMLTFIDAKNRKISKKIVKK